MKPQTPPPHHGTAYGEIAIVKIEAPKPNE
jgi:hypothetical protein